MTKVVRKRLKFKLSQMLKTSVTAFSSLLLLSACSKSRLTVAPVTETPTGQYHVGKFVWYDLLTEDVAAVEKFYGELFGWGFRRDANDDSTYTLIIRDGKPIAGIIHRDESKNENSSQWLSYLSVEDVDRAVSLFKQQNCYIHRQPFDLPDRGRVAVVSDPQGAVLVLIRAKGGDPMDAEPESGNWLWTELLTADDEAASAFYQQLAGYMEKEREVVENIPYHVLLKDDVPRAGIVKKPWAAMRSNWLPYILVSDPVAVATRAKELGGTVFLEPNKDIRDGSVAVIADPSGAGFAVQKWPY